MDKGYNMDFLNKKPPISGTLHNKSDKFLCLAENTIFNYTVR